MKHETTRSLYSYWQRLRGTRPAPERSEVEPSDIREILGETFILECVDEKSYLFRLAGTRVCASYCRELKGRNFLDFWSDDDREALESLFLAVKEDAGAAVVGLNGRNKRGSEVNFELLLLPLANRDEGYTRIVGSLSPQKAPYWMGIYPIETQYITGLRLIWPDEKPYFLRQEMPASQVTPALKIPILPKKVTRHKHLTVYEGGKT